MPVPVPRLHKPVAHPVVKHLNCADTNSSPFQHLTRTLPVSPTGPPPSYGTREQWINSLPSWRRAKPRRIWEEDSQVADNCGQQCFLKGLTAAANAPVIKGAHAEACIPPFKTLFGTSQPPARLPVTCDANDADDEMNLEYSPLDRNHLDDHSQWSATSPIDSDDRGLLCCRSDGQCLSSYSPRCPGLQVERGAFSPICDDDSPGAVSGQDRDSSPLQPITPLSEFVDRAVASILPCGEDEAVPSGISSKPDPGFEDCRPQPTFPSIADPNREPAPAPAVEAATHGASIGYKKLAEPLADWVANYVWKVCTTGFSLPSTFARSSSDSVSSYPNIPPSHLAASVHSLLLSTLLQPSAVFLALWYIIRLPVYFAAAPLEPEFAKETRFRAALLGDLPPGFDQETMEAGAPFRLLVLGCMLSNKWLDDHTFSNKTWHSISNVPIQVLNKLESLTLDIFTYDLTVPSGDWSNWLAHLMSYHMSLVSPVHPQPISRPSSNPHSIVRRALEEIIQAPAIRGSAPQPFFIGLEERKRAKIERERAMAAEVLEIDLDEDGPLRAEYLPKPRGSHSHGINLLPQSSITSVHYDMRRWENCNVQEIERSLPPPARWSPSGDEPIFPERSRMSGQYVAVQPPAASSLINYSAPYYHHVDPTYSHWNPSGTYAPVGTRAAYSYSLPSMDSAATYNPYLYGAQIPVSHSRSHSIAYEQENMRMQNHARTYSQAPYGFRRSDIRVTANEFTPCHPTDAHWLGANQYPYHCPPFAPIHTVHYPPAWVRI